MQQFCIRHSLTATAQILLYIILLCIKASSHIMQLYRERISKDTESETENILRKEIINIKRSPNKFHPVHSHCSALMLFPISRHLLQEWAGDASG